MKSRALLLIGALLAGTPANADDYPSKPIRLIVPFAAGGAVGAVARVLSAPLAQGSPVTGTIDEDRRRDHIQQHTGQHVLSAAYVSVANAPTEPSLPASGERRTRLFPRDGARPRRTTCERSIYRPPCHFSERQP